jgi:dodecin
VPLRDLYGWSFSLPVRPGWDMPKGKGRRVSDAGNMPAIGRNASSPAGKGHIYEKNYAHAGRPSHPAGALLIILAFGSRSLVDVPSEERGVVAGSLKYNIFVPIFLNSRKELLMSVASISEIKASSTESFDDAIRQGVARAVKTIRNVKSAWVQNQDILIDENGNIAEYRVQLKVTFILED